MSTNPNEGWGRRTGSTPARTARIFFLATLAARLRPRAPVSTYSNTPITTESTEPHVSPAEFLSVTYYHVAAILDPVDEASRQRRLCDSLCLGGRLRVCAHGLNGAIVYMALTSLCVWRSPHRDSSGGATAPQAH